MLYPKLLEIIGQLFKVYCDPAAILNPDSSQELFREVYWRMARRGVRHTRLPS